MKKLLLSLIIITTATQLKAQQLGIKPSDPFLFKSPKDLNLQQFKLGDSTLFKNFSTLPKGQLLAVVPNKLPDYSMKSPIAIENIDHMPIAKMNGNIDHMPIAKVSGNIDKMPGSTVIVPKSANP
jgi:hypothetical protein